MEIKENVLTAEQFLHLFTAVGWEPPSYEQAEKALYNSYATFLVFDGEKICGMARLLGDGAMSFYVKDFAVLPEMQGKGIGRMLMEYIEEFIRRNLEEGWAVSLELISAKGKEAFYEKLGFEARPCVWDGPGMFKMLR
ncbi:MAG: GNAT family N-acetyltransferase [Oscillospiraceae bacterium]|nr:GNAT family N-acetyltransferase [Oscillospiraceae bacterium]